MNEEYAKQAGEGRFLSQRPSCAPPCEPCEPCGPCEPHRPKNCCENEGKDGADWESWLPILLILFVLCGGFSGLGLGGNQCGDGCGDTAQGGVSWILILILFFCFLNNGNEGRGGLLGGLF